MSRISLGVKLLTSKDVMVERFSKADRHFVSEELGISEQNIKKDVDDKTWKFTFKMNGLKTVVEGIIRFRNEKSVRIIIPHQQEDDIRSHLRRLNPNLSTEAILTSVFERLFKEEKKAVAPQEEHGFGGGLLGLGAAQKAPVHMPEPADPRTEINGVDIPAEEEKTLVG